MELNDQPARRPEHALKSARQAQGLSLRALADRIGMPFSTLSKLENGRMAMTYDKLLKLAQGLGVDIGELVSTKAASERPAAVGRRSITRADQLPEADSQRHTHFYPAAEMRQKMMVPIIIDVKARTVEEMGGLVRHQGEEYLQVLTGAMDLHSDLYEPLRLSEGDSIYFDSGMAHAYVHIGNAPCRVLAVCAGAGMQRFANAAGESWHLTPWLNPEQGEGS